MSQMHLTKHFFHDYKYQSIINKINHKQGTEKIHAVKFV